MRGVVLIIGETSPEIESLICDGAVALPPRIWENMQGETTAHRDGFQVEYTVGWERGYQNAVSDHMGGPLSPRGDWTTADRGRRSATMVIVGANRGEHQ
jgi:hypothetical protein